MRELMSLKWIRTVATVAGAVAAICLALATVGLTRVVSHQRGDIAHQSRELECRGEVAAEVDVIRSDITLHLSRGLRALVTEDEAQLQSEIKILEDLDSDLDDASERRSHTIEICADGER